MKTSKCPEQIVVAAARRLPSMRFVIGGEGVVESEGGVADFAMLHYRQHDKECQLIGFDLLRLVSHALVVDAQGLARQASAGPYRRHSLF